MAHEIKIAETPDQSGSEGLSEAQLIVRNIEARFNRSRETYLDRFFAGVVKSWRPLARSK